MEGEVVLQRQCDDPVAYKTGDWGRRGFTQTSEDATGYTLQTIRLVEDGYELNDCGRFLHYFINVGIEFGQVFSTEEVKKTYRDT